MGHKSGLRHTEAQGKIKPLSRTELEAQQDGVEIDVKAMAQRHVKQSIKTLAKAQKTSLTKSEEERGVELAPWSVRRQAAKDLLEMAGGRPETREPERREAGLTVIINKISTGETYEKIVSETTLAQEIAGAIDAEVVDSAPKD